MADSYRCVVATPTRVLFEGDVYYADVPGYSGHYGVLKGHESLVATNHQGGKLVLWLDPDGNEKREFLIHRGCTQMLHDHLAVLARFGRPIDELELEGSKRRVEEITADIEAKEAELEGETDEDRIAAGQAWLITERIHREWHEAKIHFLETGQESTKQ